MHEYSIVEQLIDQLSEQCKDQGIEQIKELHLRRSSTFSAGALEQAYEMLSPNTPLAGAKLVIEDIQVEHTCKNCGFEENVEADDLIGHMYICPECGASEQIDEAHGLELVEVKT